MNKARVYRAGLMDPAPDAGPAEAVTRAAQARNPRPVGRAGSLFACPTMAGSVRWVLGNWPHKETRLREITVDADTVFVYEVRAWERVEVEDVAAIDAYWATGMTLTDFLATGLDAADWEVLVGPEAVISWRNVSAARFLAAAPQWRHPELRRIVRDWRTPTA